MYSIILVIIFIAGGFLLGYKTSIEAFIGGVAGGATGLFAGIAAAMLIALIIPTSFDLNLSYKIVDEEKYELVYYNENFYTSSPSILTDSYHVTVKIKTEDGLEEEKSYTTARLRINPDANEASIVIKHEEVDELDYIVNRSAQWWKENFFMDLSSKNRIGEIVISIPKNLDTNEPQDAVTEQNRFCHACGISVEDAWKYCVNCGAEIKK